MSATASQWRRRMSAREKRALTAEVLRAYVRARLVMRTNRLVECAARMRSRPIANPVEAADTRAAAVRLSSVAIRVLTKLPTDSRCLARSLVVTELLSSRAIDSTLVVGVRPAPDFSAHAWVEVDGRPVLPPGDPDMERLVEV